MKSAPYEAIDRGSLELKDKVVAWRRDIHLNPELPNREYRTAEIVAGHLTRLGLEVRTGVAHTGVIGVLKGGRPGPVVALRADMDALPVTEELDLPFASRVKTGFQGREVGVMHACGHDAHTAMLMGAAEILAEMKDDISGSVKFIFQPAEESPPPGETGGAPLMVAEGALEDPAPEVIFGLHVAPEPAGVILGRSGGIMASQDNLDITVYGRQTHGAVAWKGIDPIVAASQIVLGLQTIPSRQMDITSPAVVTIGTFQAGVLNTIIPDEAVLSGTIRCMDPAAREDIFDRVRRTAECIAQSSGARAEVRIEPELPLTFNDPDLYEMMKPSLERAAGPGKFITSPPVTGSEDFSFYLEHIPGLYFFLGINPPDVSPQEAEPCHSPRFTINEDALPVGVRALVGLVFDYCLFKD